MTVTRDLLDFAAGHHRLPDGVRAAALMLLSDTLAVGAAGSSAPGADGVLAAASGWGAGGAVPILGRDLRLPAAAAAFVNAYQIHALEWDAVHEAAVVHAMSVVTAAVHAACHSPCYGAEIDRVAALTALVVGVEIACGLGIAADTPLRFFRPATAGTIGAALACARLAGLPRERFGDVLGLAHAQCAGTMQAHVEGSLALPLQVAAAARAAITAVDLVVAGLPGPHDALMGEFGYFPMFDGGDPTAMVATLGSVWRTPEISVKPWPSGRASHATLAAIARAGSEEITAITAEVPPLVARLVGRPWLAEMTPAYARLCLPFLTALMLRDGRIDPRFFTADSFGDPLLRALGDRLTIVVDGNPDPNALSPQRFALTLAGGRTRVIDAPATLGSPTNPLSRPAQAAKLAFALSLARVTPVTDDPFMLLCGSDR